MAERDRNKFLDLRDNFELEYRSVALRLQPVLNWLETREWVNDEPLPEWVKEFEGMGRAEADARLQIRALAHAVSDTVLRAIEPSQDVGWPNLPRDLEPDL